MHQDKHSEANVFFIAHRDCRDIEIPLIETGSAPYTPINDKFALPFEGKWLYSFDLGHTEVDFTK